MSCNASKGAKLLENWLQSLYCKKKGITTETVANVVNEAIKNPPKLEKQLRPTIPTSKNER